MKILWIIVAGLLFISNYNPEKERSWKFVSMPDFVNRDVPYPEPKLDGILDFTLNAVKKEDPEFLLVPGDMVNGRWWMLEDITLTNKFVYDPVIPADSILDFHRKHLNRMAELYNGGWVKRINAHNLQFFVSVGDHDIGDDPWIGLKKPLVKDFENEFRKYYRMPLNGPREKKGLSYYFIRNKCLFIVLDPFEQDKDGSVRLEISEEQINWMENVFKKTGKKADFRIVACHVPVLNKNIEVMASSRLILPGDTESELWKTMKKNRVDLYLCGEYHAVSCQESDGILQVVHGALMGFSQYLNYLVVTVQPDELLLEVKGIETTLEKPEGEPDRLSRIARISDSQMAREPLSMGKMKIKKTKEMSILTDRTGVFADKYTRYPSIQ